MEKKNKTERTPQIAMMIWILIFISLGTIFIYNFNKTEYEEWEQSRFEEELAKGRIVSIKITHDNEKVAILEGKYIEDPTQISEYDKSDRFYRSKVVYSDRLDSEIRKQPGVSIKVENKDTWFRNLVMTILPVIIVVGFLYFLFSRQMKMAGKGAMQFGRSKARMIMPEEQDKKITFKDVAGAEEAKEEMYEIVDYLKDPLKYKMLGARIPKGALLTGPPGTGKTLLAKAIAGEAGVPFFSISGSDFVEMFVGVGASRVRDMFDTARKYTPCLVFIDEIDAVGRSRFSGIGGGHDEREQTLNALLVEMDGLETQEGTIILASTNRPDVLDPALLRPGRFDRTVVLDLPDIKGRRQILDVHSKKIKMDSSVNLDTIAKSTPGFSGADIANMINESALLAARLNKSSVSMAEIEEARDKVRWGRERRSRKISDQEKKLTAYHESGHAIVALKCTKSMPVHKVTIIPRGIAYLGATMQMPEEDRYTKSKQELIDEMTILMGGRAAEELKIGDITSGASSDIEHATRIARLMVCNFGMSEKMGTVQYGGRDEHIYLGRDIIKSESFSEDTAREIDNEIKKLIDSSAQRAKKILEENIDKLETLAQKLLECETLEGAEIKKLLGFEENPAEDSDPNQPAV
ncbi:MAG TPA: ATP-dependent zinc metalloprotease FtsH [Victivallales bacterium]|nr:ATP-dependent zinc metalloprotease FtsH [Victivallales bacterium]